MGDISQSAARNHGTVFSILNNAASGIDPQHSLCRSRIIKRRRRVMKQQRFLNQKLGKRLSRKSALERQRAKLETVLSISRRKDKSRLPVK